MDLTELVRYPVENRGHPQGWAGSNPAVALCRSRSAGRVPVLKTGKPKGHAGSNPVCGAHVGISLTGKAAVC